MINFVPVVRPGLLAHEIITFGNFEGEVSLGTHRSRQLSFSDASCSSAKLTRRLPSSEHAGQRVILRVILVKIVIIVQIEIRNNNMKNSNCNARKIVVTVGI